MALALAPSAGLGMTVPQAHLDTGVAHYKVAEDEAFTKAKCEYVALARERAR